MTVARRSCENQRKLKEYKRSAMGSRSKAIRQQKENNTTERNKGNHMQSKENNAITKENNRNANRKGSHKKIQRKP